MHLEPEASGTEVTKQFFPEPVADLSKPCTRASATDWLIHDL